MEMQTRIQDIDFCETGLHMGHYRLDISGALYLNPQDIETYTEQGRVILALALPDRWPTPLPKAADAEQELEYLGESQLRELLRTLLQTNRGIVEATMAWTGITSEPGNGS